MSKKAEWGIEIFWLDDEKMGTTIVEEIFFEYDFDTIKNMLHNVGDYGPTTGTLDGGYKLDRSNINFFEKLLERKFDLETYEFFIESYGYVKE